MKNELNCLLTDGYTKKFAVYYLNLLHNEEKSNIFEKEYMEWAHSKGFLAEHASAYNLNEQNYSNYLSDYDYYKIWPVNSWERIWINDKMTLKYMLSNVEFGCFIPEYYYYSDSKGLRVLMDAPSKKQDIEAFLTLVKTKKNIACKPCNGSGACGFFRISFEKDNFRINGENKTENEIKDFIEVHPNYIFTEYLFPEASLSKISSKIHTLRLVTINKEGICPKIIGGYLRFATNLHGEANHINDSKDCNANFDYVVDVDIESGKYHHAKAVYKNKIDSMPEHPDSKVTAEGVIPNWNKIQETVLDICKYFSLVEYMGFDIGVTEDGFKIMEINSHPGIKYMQLFHPFYNNSEIKAYFKEKIQEIDDMTTDEKERRIHILR